MQFRKVLTAAQFYTPYFVLTLSYVSLNLIQKLQYQYADDTKMMAIVNNDEDRYMLQKAIDNLHKWSNLNGLTLNRNKTVHITHFKSRKVYRERDQP